MDEATRTLDADLLVAEIQRYLAAVDAFRAAGCEPRWKRELRPVPTSSTERSR